jgi:CRP-like cAMP-binding protein
VDLKFASVLCEPGGIVNHVFFPLDSFIALVAQAGRNVRLEVGLVGSEGMLGLTVMLGVPTSALRWLVQGAGRALRIDVVLFLRELADSPELLRGLNRYLYVVLAQLAQAAACKRFHVVEGRLARQLLMTRDRARADTFHVTHDTLAYLLGVRRAGITRAASSLQRRKLIRYARGDLRILDGRGLEAASCGCYAADNETYGAIIGRRTARRPRTAAA